MAVIETFKAKTKALFHSIGAYSLDEIESLIKDHVADIIEENGLGVTVVDFVISGSRCRGLEHEGSDLDVVVEYLGAISEDMFFNVLNEDCFAIDGIAVDFDPITKGKTGTLAEYLPRVEKYLLNSLFN